MRPKADVIDALVKPGIVAVVRALSAQQVIPLAEALLAGGIHAVEVTMTTPDALKAITQASKHFGEKALLGVGTVLNAETARQAIAAGAEFVVSPITRPRLATSDDVPNAYHVADGGYYDNYGVVSLVEGLRRVLNIYGKKSGPEASPQSPTLESAGTGVPSPPRKILVVEIRASDSREAKEAKRRAGWAFGTAGPVMTLLNVWGSGQTPRNDLDLQLLKEVAKNRGFEVETVLFPLVSDAPLSWHLTESQKQDIERGWDWCAAMPARQGQKSKVQLGLEKARAFLTQSAGWKGLPPTRFNTPSEVSPEDMQGFCLGLKPLATRQARPAAQRAGLQP